MAAYIFFTLLVDRRYGLEMVQATDTPLTVDTPIPQKRVWDKSPRPVARFERIWRKRATKGSQLRLTPIDKQSKTGIIRLSTLMLID